MKEITKKFIKSFVMCGVTFVALSLVAATETVGDYTWTYRINGDTAEICITNWGSLAPAISPLPIGAVTIPSTLGGKPVTSIDSYAFNGCSGLTSVTIPDGVMRIGASAFSYCTGLTSVTIPDSVTNIGDDAFSNCIGLLSIIVGEGNTKFSSINGLLLTKDGSVLVKAPMGLTSVEIPASVMRIGSSAFSGCNDLRRIDIVYNEDRVHDMLCDDYAFLGMPSGVEIHKYDSNGELTNTWSVLEVNNTGYIAERPIIDPWGYQIWLQDYWSDWGWGTPCFAMTTDSEIYSQIFCCNDKQLLSECFFLYSESGKKLEYGVDWYLVSLDDEWMNYAGSMGLPAGVYKFLIVGIGNYAGTYYFNIEINRADYDCGPWLINMAFDGQNMYYGDGSDRVFYGEHGSYDTVVVSSYMYGGAPQPEVNVHNSYYTDTGYTISYGTASDGGSSSDNMYTVTVTFLDAGRYDVSAYVDGWLTSDDYANYSFSSDSESCTVIIRPRPIEELTVGLSEESRTTVYTGDEICPNLEWEVEGRTYFDYEYLIVTNAGTYQIAIGAEMNDDGYFFCS